MRVELLAISRADEICNVGCRDRWTTGNHVLRCQAEGEDQSGDFAQNQNQANPLFEIHANYKVNNRQERTVCTIAYCLYSVCIPCSVLCSSTVQSVSLYTHCRQYRQTDNNRQFNSEDLTPKKNRYWCTTDTYSISDICTVQHMG